MHNRTMRKTTGSRAEQKGRRRRQGGGRGEQTEEVRQTSIRRQSRERDREGREAEKMEEINDADWRGKQAERKTQSGGIQRKKKEKGEENSDGRETTNVCKQFIQQEGHLNRTNTVGERHTERSGRERAREHVNIREIAGSVMK